MLCIVLLVAGTAAAVLTRDHRAAAVGIVLVLVGVGVVLVAGAELGVWHVDLPEPSSVPSAHHPVCRSGGDSHECPGG